MNKYLSFKPSKVPITMIGFPLIIYRSPLPHTYMLSFLHRHPESFRPVTSAPTHFF